MYLFPLRGLLLGCASSYFYPALALLIYYLIPQSAHGSYLLILSLNSLISSLLLFQRYRTLSDTATSPLNNAAQGYTQLTGVAMTLPHETGPGPYYLPPVVWFRNATQASWHSFLIQDEQGSCTIDPQSAEIITPLYFRQQHWYRAIFPGQTLYALGQVTTISQYQTDTEKRQAVLSLLAKWKKDPTDMLKRFDQNGDGKIDPQELLMARDEAERIIDGHLDYEYQQPATHIIEKPADRRPFILSSIPIQQLLRRYQRMLLSHLIAWPILGLLSLLSL